MGNINTGERGSYIAHCATFQKPIRTTLTIPVQHPVVKIREIVPVSDEKDIEMIDLVNNKELDIKRIERQRKLQILLAIIRKQRDRLMNKSSLSWMEKEEVSRINYIVDTINSKHITEEHLNDLLIYITSIIKCSG